MAHATFSDLPPEIAGNVFAFIRSKADRGAACLISHAWRDLMAPILWERLKTDLRTVSPQSLAILLHPNSDILSHVRELTILSTTLSSNEENLARLVIVGIPRDRIRRFSSYCKITTLTLQLLLQSQRKIAELHVWSTFTTPGRSKSSELYAEEHHAWMGPSLSEISAMSLTIKPHITSEERIFHGMRSLSRYCPKIQDLSLDSPSPDNYKDTSLCAILRHDKELQLFSNLKFLRLYDIKVAATGDQALCEILDLCKLRELQLYNCDYLIPFLEGLSSFYTCNTGGLHNLTIVLPIQLEEPTRTMKAIEKLLEVCPKHQDLEVDLSLHGFIVKECILAHSQTLRSLMLGTGKSSSGSYSSVADMMAILGACTKLKRLAVNMPDSYANLCLSPEFSICIDGEFKDMLTAISTHPAIRALRILSFPKITFYDQYVHGETVPSDRLAAFRQVIMQNYANQIFHVMAGRGSDLKVLTIKPSCKKDGEHNEDLVKDANGHQWPEYHYVRGRVLGITGTNVVVAHPSSEISLDFPDMESFFDYIC